MSWSEEKGMEYYIGFASAWAPIVVVIALIAIYILGQMFWRPRRNIEGEKMKSISGPVSRG